MDKQGKGRKLVKLFGISIVDYTTVYQVEEKDIEIMQYTGLKSKSGVEIYEGDLINHVQDPNGFTFPEPYCHQIVWSGSGFTIADRTGYAPALFLLDDKWTELLEVIGNVWENPELVNVERIH